MPTDAVTLSAADKLHPAAVRRTHRLALGTALALLFSQLVHWPLSFVVPALTLTLLATPLPQLKLKQGVIFVLAFLVPIVAATALIPILTHARWAGILLVALFLFYTFYFTAKGGSAVIGSFMTIGLTLTVTIGSVNPGALMTLIEVLAKSAVFGVIFVWLAHVLLPDTPAEKAPQKVPHDAATPDLIEARRRAYRSLIIVLPLALIFMFASGSPSYTVVMIKVASMGQQASTSNSRKMGLSLIESTLWGGLGAAILWFLLSALPSLIFYVLFIFLAGLLFGRRIFLGSAVHPKSSMWSYAFLTMVIIIAPAVLDNPGSSGAEIWTRLALFIGIAVYGTVAAAVFDAFWSGPKSAPSYSLAAEQSE